MTRGDPQQVYLGNSSHIFAASPENAVFRIRVLLSGSGSDFFPQSGSGSAKNLDPIRNTRIQEKKVQEEEKNVDIIFSTLKSQHFIFCKVPPNVIKEHHLDPFSLLKNNLNLN